MNISELFGALQQKAEKASLDASLEVSVSVTLTGSDPAQWQARAEGGRLTLAEGENPGADVTVTASSETAIALYEKKLSPMMAFLTGKIKLGGDVAKIALLKKLAGK
ncbi:MAG: SCP2 sterol-binding domain-containing protein [Candidatus Adiutrix sp.]|jgi:putative sterol carrier protein|nr:SCP2 sterol-binding domain-containing protein [Candidatus Adiutrix sp.]